VATAAAALTHRFFELTLDDSVIFPEGEFKFCIVPPLKTHKVPFPSLEHSYCDCKIVFQVEGSRMISELCQGSMWLKFCTKVSLDLSMCMASLSLFHSLFFFFIRPEINDVLPTLRILQDDAVIHTIKVLFVTMDACDGLVDNAIRFVGAAVLGFLWVERLSVRPGQIVVLPAFPYYQLEFQL
jgi:hypothetical protein